DVWDTKQVTGVEITFDGPGIFNVDGEAVFCSKGLESTVSLPVGKDEVASAGPAKEAVLPTWRADPARWRMLLLYMFECMSNQDIWIGFAPIGSDVMTEYGVSATFVNFLSMIFMIVYLPANFPASYAMDVLGCRWALLVGGCLQTFGAILRCLPADAVTARYLVMLGQALAAVGQPFFTDMPPKIAADWFPAYQRVLADTLASLAMPVGAAVGFVLPVALGLCPMLYFHLAWSALFLSLTFFFFQAAPATPPSPTRKHHEGKSFGQELAAALSNGNLWCLILSFSLRSLWGRLATVPMMPPSSGHHVLWSPWGSLHVRCRLDWGAQSCPHHVLIFALLAVLTVIYVGDGPWGVELLALAFGGLGFSAIPLMPISFEAAVMVSQAGEGTLAGLCMSGGQILGIGQTLILGQLLQSGQPRVAWILLGGLFLVALLAVSVLNAMQTDSCKLCTCTKNARHWHFEARWLEDCFSNCK
ncbi:FLVCR1, partial [Symbiodinium necroappetens]